MKKLVSIFLCVVMLAAIAAFAVNADGNVRYTQEEPSADFVLDRFPEHFDSAENEDAIVNFDGGDDSNICLKNGSAVIFNFTAEKAGTYTFAVRYAARVGVTRAQDYAIDGGERVYCELELCEDNTDQRWWMFDADLEAGEHTVTIATPTGFDDSTIKSCDFYQIVAWLSAEKVAEPVVEEAPAAEEAAAVEEAPAAEVAPVVEEAPVVVTPAAQTFDVIFALVAICAASAAVIVKKK